MQPTELLDVFISYRHSHKESVLTLCKSLEAAGITYFRDEDRRDDDPSIQATVEKGIARSRLFLAWYDDTYLQSKACAWEFCRALMLAYASGSGLQRVLCVDPTRKFSHIVPISILDQAQLVSFDDLRPLIDLIRKRLAACDAPFGELKTSGFAQWFERGEPSHPTWVGRATDLVSLVHHLEGGKLGMMGGINAPVAITGWGGDGKTMLAEHYALSFSSVYPGGIVWLSGATEDGVTPREGQWKDQLESGLSAVAVGKLRLDVAELTKGIPDPNQRIRILKSAIETELLKRAAAAPDEPRLSDYLWIIDDLPQGLSHPDDMKLWTAPSGKGHTLATIREAEGAGTVFHVHSISQLGPEDALSLLCSHCEPGSEADYEDACRIVEELGRLPLALSLGASMVKRHGFAKYLDMLNKYSSTQLDSLAEKLKPVLPTGHSHSIVATFLRSLDQVPGAHASSNDEVNAAWIVLRVAALLSPHPLPDTLALRTLRAIGIDNAEYFLDEAISILPTLGVAKRGGSENDEFSMHILLARTLLEAHMSEEEKAHALDAMVRATDEWRIEQEQVAPAEVDRRLFTLANQLISLNELPESVAIVAETGILASTAGEYVHSLQILQNAHKILRTTLGENHDATLIVMGQHSLALQLIGDLAGARERQERLLDTQSHTLGTDHPNTLVTMANLAVTIKNQGDLDGARVIEERALDLYARTYGMDHQDTLRMKSNLAVTIKLQGDLLGATKLNGEVLEARSRTLGEEHPDTLLSMANVALSLAEMGQWVGARAILAQVLDSQRKYLGEDHPITLQTKANLAVALVSLGDLNHGHALFEHVYVSQRRVLGEDHPETIKTMNNLKILAGMDGK